MSIMGYTKLFNELIASTVWREAYHTKIVWITMLAMKDRWHIVNASIPGLAVMAGVTEAECEEAIACLMRPDKHSRSQEHEGRRIEPCQGGWAILNGEKYRNKMSLDERREYNRIKQREYRANVKSCQQKSTQSAHTETDYRNKEQSKELKKKKEKNSIKLSARQKLEAFEVSNQFREWARTNKTPDPDQQLEGFKDYWRGRKDKDLKEDWAATYRNNLKHLRDNPSKMSIDDSMAMASFLEAIPHD